MMERLRRGFQTLRERARWFLPRFLPTIWRGSYVGDDTMQRTSPVEGSMATIEPIFPSMSLSPSACSFMSRVSVRSFPATGLRYQETDFRQQDFIYLRLRLFI